MEQPRHTQQIYHGKDLDLIPASISFILVKRQNGYKIGGKKTTKKKSQNYFFKQNKSTFILHKPGNHDQLEILESFCGLVHSHSR